MGFNGGQMEYMKPHFPGASSSLTLHELLWVVMSIIGTDEHQRQSTRNCATFVHK
jgi:hypothetical protein